MNAEHTVTVSELLETLTHDLSEADIIYAEVLAKISNGIVNERIRRGLNQKDFADLLDVSQGQISKWENDEVNFTIKKLSKIAAKLNLRLSCSLEPYRPEIHTFSKTELDNVLYISSYNQDSGSRWESKSSPQQIVYLKKEM